MGGKQSITTIVADLTFIQCHMF